MAQAVQLAAERTSSYRDPLILAAAKYLEHEHDPQWLRLRARWQPALVGAMALQRDQKLSELAYLMILGNLPRPEICQRLGIELPVLDMWVALFCDLEDRRKATDWIDCRLIAPVERQGNAELGFQLRRALYCGPVVTRSMLNMDADIIRAAAGQPMDRFDATVQKLFMLAEVAIADSWRTPQGAMRLIALAVRLIIAQPQIDLAIAQRKDLETQGEQREQQLADLRRQLDAAQAELAELRATTSKDNPTAASDVQSPCPPARAA
ncbi:MAG TPA: hypothetical protein VMP01_23785 [Pirellulaceae bacterium]|nr:hypothetical protein [Pirellulaceae bacterium]